MLHIVVMGVAGSGKSSVGGAVAGRLGAEYLDGDDLHPPANIEKMSNGISLTDEDRWPWLAEVGAVLQGHPGPVLIGCSALRRIYRDKIRDVAAKPVCFLHLVGSREVIAGRMGERDGHFMPLALLDSQFATLEIPDADESVVAVDIDQPFEDVVAQAVSALRAL
ncbi:MAG: gluconokinase [Pseudomonadota bacterium]